MEYRNSGVMEYWSGGVMGLRMKVTGIAYHSKCLEDLEIVLSFSYFS
jgi:hypothetical protein